MINNNGFSRFTAEYDAWYDRNRPLYEQELAAIDRLLPQPGIGLEVGVGTGRFAGPLGIDFGLDISLSMSRRAAARAVTVVCGRAEELPFKENEFDYILLMTALSFLADPITATAECARCLKPGGRIVIGFIDRDSALGRKYLQKRDQSRFYGAARLMTAAEVAGLLTEVGFTEPDFLQILLPTPESDSPDPVIVPGYGEGGFVVVRAKKTG